MNLYGWLMVAGGGILGCLLRWRLGVLFNPLFPTVPLGTIAANLAAGFVIGISIALSEHYATVPAEVRLFLATGFCGGLSTMSTFAAESFTLISKNELLWGAAHLGMNVIGSILMVMIGIQFVRFILSGGGAIL